MPRRSRVMDLEETVRKELDRRIVASGFLRHRDHARWLQDQGYGEFSEKVIERYALRLRRLSALAATEPDRDENAPRPQRPHRAALPTIYAIQRRVAEHFGIEGGMLISSSQGRSGMAARHVAMLLSRRLTAHTVADIGRHFGDRTCQAVQYGCERAEALAQADPEMAAAIEAMAAELAGPAPSGRPTALGRSLRREAQGLEERASSLRALADEIEAGAS